MHTVGSLLFYKASKGVRGKPYFLHSSSTLTGDYMINISHTSWVHSSKKLLSSWFHWKWWFFFFLWKMLGFWWFFLILRMQPCKQWSDLIFLTFIRHSWLTISLIFHTHAQMCFSPPASPEHQLLLTAIPSAYDRFTHSTSKRKLATSYFKNILSIQQEKANPCLLHYSFLNLSIHVWFTIHHLISLQINKFLPLIQRFRNVFFIFLYRANTLHFPLYSLPIPK